MRPGASVLYVRAARASLPNRDHDRDRSPNPNPNVSAEVDMVATRNGAESRGDN